MMPGSLVNRIPQIAAQIPTMASAVAKLTAERIEERAKEKVPVGLPDVHLRDAIHVERAGAGEYAVVAGDNQSFYGHIVEFGSVRASAHPFLIPAVEETQPEVQQIATGIMKAKGL